MHRAARTLPLLIMACLAAPVCAQNDSASGDPPAFAPGTAKSLEEVEAALLQTSPRIAAQRLDMALTAADRDKARLLPNPTLDLGWGTIPLGQTNPEGLRAPMANVPNYGVGVAYTFEIGKRGKRQAWTDAAHWASRAQLRAETRRAALDLLDSVGELARATLRLQSTNMLMQTGERTLEVARSRFEQGFGSGLEVDRIELEVARARQQMAAVGDQIAKAQLECTATLGVQCPLFRDGAQARAFLQHWISAAPVRAGPSEHRPDIYALDAELTAAQREADLARAAALPDPTVRLGYLHDRFVAAGNQMHSLNLSVSAPIPIFDRGQAELQAAQARANALAEQRSRLLAIAAARGPLLRARLSAARLRLAELSNELVPRATQMLVQVSNAAEGRLVSITDVIQAHRALGELVLEEADGYADAFSTSLQLLAELPPAAAQGVQP